MEKDDLVKRISETLKATVRNVTMIGAFSLAAAGCIDDKVNKEYSLTVYVASEVPPLDEGVHPVPNHIIALYDYGDEKPEMVPVSDLAEEKKPNYGTRFIHVSRSPDDSTLAFTHQKTGSNEGILWAYSTKDRKLKQVYEGKFEVEGWKENKLFYTIIDETGKLKQGIYNSKTGKTSEELIKPKNDKGALNFDYHNPPVHFANNNGSRPIKPRMSHYRRT